MLKQNTECTEEQPIPQKRLFSIFLTGPPGAGKTTQLQYIEDHFSHYSNVVMSQNKTLKKEAIGAYIKTKSKKPMKQQLLNALSQQGKLTCCRMVTKKVRGIKNDSSSSSENEKPVVWVYSRGPSSVEQAQFLFDYYDICPDLYIVLEMNSVQRLIDRVTHRRVDPVTNRTYNRLIHTESLEEHVQQRLICRAVDELSSVDEKVFMKRMNKYHQRMEPVISYYQALNEQSTSKYVNILHVDATQNPEDVWNEIQTAINKLMHKNRSQIDAYNNNIQQLLPNPSLTSKVSDEEDSSSLSSSPSDDEEAPLSHSSSEESLLWV